MEIRYFLSSEDTAPNDLIVMHETRSKPGSKKP